MVIIWLFWCVLLLSVPEVWASSNSDDLGSSLSDDEMFDRDFTYRSSDEGKKETYSVSCVDSKVTGELREFLKTQPIHGLFLRNIEATEDDLKRVISPSLTHLSIQKMGLEDRHLDLLHGLTQLQDLNICDNRFTSNFLDHLPATFNLHTFACRNVPLTVESLMRINAMMPKLQALSVESCGLTDSVLDVLLSFPHLNYVCLRGNKLTKDAFYHFERKAMSNGVFVFILKSTHKKERSSGERAKRSVTGRFIKMVIR